MKPHPWFEKAIKALDSRLELIPRPQEGVFVLARKGPKGVKWTNIEIPYNRQDETMLTHVRRCDSWNEREIQRFTDEVYWQRNEEKRNAQRRIDDRSAEIVADAGRALNFNPVYQSAPKVGDTFIRGQVEHLNKLAEEQSGESNGSGAS